jgi:hypothetical protein
VSTAYGAFMFAKRRNRVAVDLPTGVSRPAGGGEILVEELAPWTPFLLDDGEATVIVRPEGLPADEVEALARAVRADRCVLLAAYRLYPTYPVLIFSLLVHDRPGSPPLSIEAYRDCTSADVRGFAARLGSGKGRGRVLLYGGEPLGPLATGRFTLRIPPLAGPVPRRTSWRELRMLWLMFEIMVRQRDRIPAACRDFAAAVAAHMAREPNLTAGSEPMGP